jgi:hypothetical protein
VLAIEGTGNKLYIGGQFLSDNVNTRLNSVAQTDENQINWSSVGGGLCWQVAEDSSCAYPATVYTLTIAPAVKIEGYSSWQQQ